MKKIIKLTEKDLERIVKRVINEDVGTRFGSKVGGFMDAIDSRISGEGKDVRQLIKAAGRLKNTAYQLHPWLTGLRNDLDKLFNEGFMNRVTKYNKNALSNKELGPKIEEFKNLLESYKTLLDQVIPVNEEIKNLNIIERQSVPTDNTQPDNTQSNNQ